MLGVQLLFNYVPFMNRLFQSAPVRAESWLHVAIVGAVVFLLIEIEKWIRYGGKRGRGTLPE